MVSVICPTWIGSNKVFSNFLGKTVSFDILFWNRYSHNGSTRFHLFWSLICGSQCIYCCCSSALLFLPKIQSDNIYPPMFFNFHTLIGFYELHWTLLQHVANLVLWSYSSCAKRDEVIQLCKHLPLSWFWESINKPSRKYLMPWQAFGRHTSVHML